MPCSPIFASWPVNPGRQVDRSTGGQLWNTHNPLLCPGPVNPGRQVDRWTINGLTGSEVNIGEHGIMGNPYLFTCRPVTCLLGLKGPETNKGEQGIMGNPYLITCRPVNLSTRVDRTRVKYI